MREDLSKLCYSIRGRPTQAAKEYVKISAETFGTIVYTLKEPGMCPALHMPPYVLTALCCCVSVCVYFSVHVLPWGVC